MEKFPDWVQSCVGNQAQIIGNFNLWVDDPANKSANSFVFEMSHVEFIQKIKEQTHVAGHTHDLVLVKNLEVNDLELLPVP